MNRRTVLKCLTTGLVGVVGWTSSGCDSGSGDVGDPSKDPANQPTDQSSGSGSQSGKMESPTPADGAPPATKQEEKSGANQPDQPKG